MNFQLVVVGVLILLNGLLAGSEIALISLREGQLQRLEAASNRGAALARLARDPNRFLATIQLGITLAGVLASASAAISLAEPVAERLAFTGRAAPALSILSVTLALSYLTLVLGELVPKRLAMQRAETWGLVVARPLSLLASLTRPAVWCLSRSTDIVVRLLGGDPDRDREAITEEEIRELVASQPSFTTQQRTIIDGAIKVAERNLREVLRPRPAVFIIDADIDSTQARLDLAASGHSRAPVCPQQNLDDAIGIVHLRDLLSDDARPVRELATPVTVLPESAGVLPTLREMQSQRRQMAIVVNEHGGAEGIVTIEDLVEELVGEIYDETDRDLLTVRTGDDGTLIVPGAFPVHDLVDLGIEIPPGDYATLAGFLLAELQRLPEEAGDEVEHGTTIFTVTKVEGRAISEVMVRWPTTGGHRSAAPT